MVDEQNYTVPEWRAHIGRWIQSELKYQPSLERTTEETLASVLQHFPAHVRDGHSWLEKKGYGNLSLVEVGLEIALGVYLDQPLPNNMRNSLLEYLTDWYQTWRTSNSEQFETIFLRRVQDIVIAIGCGWRPPRAATGTSFLAAGRFNWDRAFLALTLIIAKEVLECIGWLREKLLNHNPQLNDLLLVSIDDWTNESVPLALDLIHGSCRCNSMRKRTELQPCGRDEHNLANWDCEKISLSQFVGAAVRGKAPKMMPKAFEYSMLFCRLTQSTEDTTVKASIGLRLGQVEMKICMHLKHSHNINLAKTARKESQERKQEGKKNYLVLPDIDALEAGTVYEIGNCNACKNPPDPSYTYFYLHERWFFIPDVEGGNYRQLKARKCMACGNLVRTYLLLEETIAERQQLLHTIESTLQELDEGEYPQFSVEHISQWSGIDLDLLAVEAEYGGGGEIALTPDMQAIIKMRLAQVLSDLKNDILDLEQRRQPIIKAATCPLSWCQGRLSQNDTEDLWILDPYLYIEQRRADTKYISSLSPRAVRMAGLEGAGDLTQER